VQRTEGDSEKRGELRLSTEIRNWGGVKKIPWKKIGEEGFKKEKKEENEKKSSTGGSCQKGVK